MADLELIVDLTIIVAAGVVLDRIAEVVNEVVAVAVGMIIIQVFFSEVCLSF